MSTIREQWQDFEDELERGLCLGVVALCNAALWGGLAYCLWSAVCR